MTKLIPRANTAIEKRRARRQRRLQQMVREGNADNTNLSYNGDLQRFSLWLIDNGEDPLVALDDDGGLILPAPPPGREGDDPKKCAVAMALYSINPLLLGEYIVDLEEKALRISTINRAVAAISSAHEARGWTSPAAAPGVKAALKSIRRKQKVKPNRKDPVLLRNARQLLRALPEDEIGLRDRAIIIIGLGGGFRRSELAALRIENVKIGDDAVLVDIEKSKSDGEGKGHIKKLGALPNDVACPVAILRAWLAVISDDKSRPLFRRIRRGGHITEDGLTGHSIATIIKGAAKRAGVDPKNISGHSLRRGYGQTLDEAGVPMSQIQQALRHADPSTTAAYLESSETESRLADVWSSLAEPEG